MQILILFFIALSGLYAQNPGIPVQSVTTAPSGACSGSKIAYRTPNGTLYTCQSGTWAQVGGGGSGPATTAAGCIQFNSSGSFACDAGLIGGSTAITNGLLAVTYTAASSGQNEAVRVTTTLGGSTGAPTNSSFYAINNLAVTGGSTAHNLAYVANSTNSATGTNVFDLDAGYYSYHNKTGSSTGGLIADFRAEGIAISAGSATWAMLSLGAAPSKSGSGNYTQAIGIDFSNYQWTVASAGKNAGIGFSPTACGVNATWYALLDCSTAPNIINGPLSFNGQGNPTASGTASIIDFGNNYSGATTGEFALITGRASHFAAGTATTILALDLTCGSDDTAGHIVTNAGCSKMTLQQANGGTLTNAKIYDAQVITDSGSTVTNDLIYFNAGNIADNSNTTVYHDIYGIRIGTMKPSVASSGTAYSAYFADSAALFYTASELKYAYGNTTGAGSALLGANSPAVTLTAPYKWLTVQCSDGSTCYIPAWK